MLRISFILVNLSSLLSQRDCTWQAQIAGLQARCLPGWIATGACGSGRRAACKESLLDQKHHTLLKCCSHKYNTDLEHDCTNRGGNYGDERYCDAYSTEENPDDIFYRASRALCTSANRKDCSDGDNRKVNFSLECCQTSDVKVGPRDYCTWKFDNGEAGTLLECDKDYALAGVCGSGSDTDCDNKNSYFGIYCCPYEDVRG